MNEVEIKYRLNKLQTKLENLIDEVEAIYSLLDNTTFSTGIKNTIPDIKTEVDKSISKSCNNTCHETTCNSTLEPELSYYKFT